MIYTMFMDKMAPGILRLSVMDNDLDLFEGQYPVPQGVSYNSYLIEDDQLCLLDTVDARKQEEWLAGLDEVLAGRKLDYLVISHMEPDHAGAWMPREGGFSAGMIDLPIFSLYKIRRMRYNKLK